MAQVRMALSSPVMIFNSYRCPHTKLIEEHVLFTNVEKQLS
jgi:hypothetical protein